MFLNQSTHHYNEEVNNKNDSYGGRLRQKIKFPSTRQQRRCYPFPHIDDMQAMVKPGSKTQNLSVSMTYYNEWLTMYLNVTAR